MQYECRSSSYNPPGYKIIKSDHVQDKPQQGQQEINIHPVTRDQNNTENQQEAETRNAIKEAKKNMSFPFSFYQGIRWVEYKR